MGASEARLNALKVASEEFFRKERTRLTNESKFLSAILTGRNGGVTVQDISTRELGVKLIASVSDYIGRPHDAEESTT